MLQTMAQELGMRKAYLGTTPVTSIYLGGGTPSLLAAAALAPLLTLITHHFAHKEPLEVTLEANPDDITLAKLQDWKALGINRLSIGIQSFQDQVLRYLNRVHDRASALTSVALARKAGFEHLSIDLMYAIPGVSEAMWRNDLAIALQLQPVHLSAYCLTIEKNTAFGHWHKTGKLKAVEEAIAARQFTVLVEVLEAHDYEHYEISSFTQQRRYAKHNMNYWKQGKYLGIGPGAHSYDGTTRQYNVAHNQHYIDRIQQHVLPCTVEVLTKENHINEYIMTSLRTKWGCDMAWLKAQYGYDLPQTRHTYLQQLVIRKLAVINDQQLVLTLQGKLLADQIAIDLFVDYQLP